MQSDDIFNRFVEDFYWLGYFASLKVKRIFI